MFAHALKLAAVLAICTCTPTREISPKAAPVTDTGSARVAQHAPGAAEEQSAADAVVAQALRLVSDVRGLQAKSRVPGIRLGRAELKLEVERMLADDAPPDLVAGNTELLFALDTVPADFDLKAALSVLYGAQLAGFYDPEKKRMVLAADLDEDAERMTLYHELVHALQDQHYDLANGLDWKPEQSDVQAALHSLGEGDATNAMLDVFARAQGLAPREVPAELLRLDALLMQAAPDLASVPGIITRSLVAPYADGLAFVNAMRQRFDGYSGVDLAWRERPLSTEHILHPDKYLAREAVLPVAEISPPSGFGPASFRDVMGEQSLKLFFEEWLPANRAAEAASDWGGDRLAVFSKGTEHVVLWHLIFDTEPAAQRALTALARGPLRSELPARSVDPAPIRAFSDAGLARARTAAGRFCEERSQRGAFAMVRHGRHIGVTLGPYARSGTTVRGSGSCPQALQWAQGLAHQQ